MSDSLDKAIRLLDLWHEKPESDANKHMRWQLIMGVDAPYNPDLLLERLRGLLETARTEIEDDLEAAIDGDGRPILCDDCRCTVKGLCDACADAVGR